MNVHQPSDQKRMARCSCGKIEPSNPATQFGFEYRGPGSRAAVENCGKCGYFECAHELAETGAPHLTHLVDHLFTPHGPYEFDSFYCGHAGWD